jgi:hypothetical protein
MRAFYLLFGTVTSRIVTYLILSLRALVSEFTRRLFYYLLLSFLLQRLFNVNSEIFDGIPILDQKESLSNKENIELYAALDTIDDSTQATALPLLVGAALLVSFLLLGLTSSINQSVSISPNIDLGFLQQIQQQYGPYFLQFVSSITLFSNAAVCSLFSKSEIQAAFKNLFSLDSNDATKSTDAEDTGIFQKLSQNRAAIPFIISLVISLVSFLSPPGGAAWPVQNILNICIAVTAGGSVQLIEGYNRKKTRVEKSRVE